MTSQGHSYWFVFSPKYIYTSTWQRWWWWFAGVLVDLSLTPENHERERPQATELVAAQLTDQQHPAATPSSSLIFIFVSRSGWKTQPNDMPSQLAMVRTVRPAQHVPQPKKNSDSEGPFHTSTPDPKFDISGWRTALGSNHGVEGRLVAGAGVVSHRTRFR